MSKYAKSTIIILAIIALIFIFNKKDNESIVQKPLIKIGVTLPLTGDVASVGIASQTAMNMALDKWKAKDTKYDYELVFEDNQLMPNKVATNANRLIGLEKVDSIASIWGFVEIIKGITKNKDIINFSCSWGTSAADGEYNFNHSTPPSAQIKVLISKLKQENIKTIGIWHQKSSTDYELINTYIPELEKAGVDILFKVETSLEDRDYRTQIAKLKNTKPDILLLLAANPSMEIIRKQMLETGFDVPVTTVDYFTMVEDKKLFEGFWFVSDASGTNEFAQKFTKKSELSLGACVANTYDMVDMLIYSYENATSLPDEKPHNEEVIKVLHNIKGWNGAIGKDLSIDSNGQVQSQADLMLIKNGKVIPLD